MAYISENWLVENPERYRSHSLAEVKLRVYSPSYPSDWAKRRKIVVNFDFVRSGSYLGAHFTQQEVQSILPTLCQYIGAEARISLVNELIRRIPIKRVKEIYADRISLRDSDG